MNKEVFKTALDENEIKQFGEAYRAFLIWFEQWCDEVQEAIRAVIENFSVEISPNVKSLFEELSDLAESVECDDEYQNEQTVYFIFNSSAIKAERHKKRYFFIKARGPPEANKKLADSLTDKVLKNKYYEKWNGELPIVSGDGGAVVIPSDMILSAE